MLYNLVMLKTSHDNIRYDTGQTVTKKINSDGCPS